MLVNICDNYYNKHYKCDNHYEDDKEEIKKNIKNELNSKNSENECFICYETSCDKIIKLNNQNYYFKTCKCDGYIHKKCLDIWVDTTSKCPICRNFINKNTIIESKIIHPKYSIFILYILFKKNFLKIMRTLFVIIFFYYTSEYYINIFKYKVLNKNYYKNEYHLTNYNCLINSSNINKDNNVIVHPICFD
jgi:hypothetical protein